MALMTFRLWLMKFRPWQPHGLVTKIPLYNGTIYVDDMDGADDDERFDAALHIAGLTVDQMSMCPGGWRHQRYHRLAEHSPTVISSRRSLRFRMTHQMTSGLRLMGPQLLDNPLDVPAKP
jgi:hypothetical protein